MPKIDQLAINTEANFVHYQRFTFGLYLVLLLQLWFAIWTSIPSLYADISLHHYKIFDISLLGIQPQDNFMQWSSYVGMAQL